MSWFGLGGSSEKERGQSSSASDSSFSEPAIDTSNFSQPSSFSTPSRPVSGGNSLQEELMMEQQRALIQAIMFKLTEMSFDSCVTKPSSSLSSSESACISAVTGKYLETSAFILGKLNGQQ